MSGLLYRERLIATGFCLLGLLACAAMWFEAGLHRPERTLNFFGGSSKVPLMERKYPESTLLFVTVGWIALLAGTWGLGGSRDEPLWWSEGIGRIFAGCVLGLLIFQARWINGHSMKEFQPGFYLGMLCCLGMCLTGIKVIGRLLYR
jgi:hypothetical protein